MSFCCCGERSEEYGDESKVDPSVVVVRAVVVVKAVEVITMKVRLRGPLWWLVLLFG